MDALEAMKTEGNALFQQKRLSEAVRVYSSVIDKLRDVSNDQSEAAARLETAVRLNRAWAWIQMSDNATEASALCAAEQDCSAVLVKDTSCVKAFYRRALARERMGHWKLALEDATVMKRLESGNPSVDPLLERLQQRIQEEDLAPKLRQCTLNNDGVANQPCVAASSHLNLAGEAEDAWRVLQADEKSLQKVYLSSAKRSSKGRRKPKRASEDKTIHSGPTATGEISEKTEDLWESLRREEATTVAKAFSRSRKSSRED